MRKTTMTIAAGCTTLTVGLLLLFNNSPGRENTVSPPISGISSEADTSENVSPSMDEEPSVTMVNEDVSVTSDTKPLKDQSTDEESLTSMALEVYSITNEGFRQLPEEDQDKMMKAFVDQFWEDELRPAEESPQQEHRLSLDIFNRPYMQTITEREFWKLSPQDQEKVIAETVESARQTRTHTQNIINEARLGMADNDYVRAEACLLYALETGRELSGNKERMLITRMVGISCEKDALNEMVKLYDRVADHLKIQMAEEQLRDIDKEVGEIRNTAKEFEANR